MNLEPNIEIDKRQSGGDKDKGKNSESKGGAEKNLKRIVNNKLDTLLNEVKIINTNRENSKKISKLPPKIRHAKNNQELGTYSFEKERK